MIALRWAMARARWSLLADQAKRRRCGCFIAVVRGACEVDGGAQAFGGTAAPAMSERT